MVHQSLVVKLVQCVKLHEEVMCLCCFTCRNDKLCHLTVASTEVHLSEESLAKEQYSSTCLMSMLVRGGFLQIIGAPVMGGSLNFLNNRQFRTKYLWQVFGPKSKNHPTLVHRE